MREVFNNKSEYPSMAVMGLLSSCAAPRPVALWMPAFLTAESVLAAVSGCRMNVREWLSKLDQFAVE